MQNFLPSDFSKLGRGAETQKSGVRFRVKIKIRYFSDERFQTSPPVRVVGYAIVLCKVSEQISAWWDPPPGQKIGLKSLESLGAQVGFRLESCLRSQKWQLMYPEN